MDDDGLSEQMNVAFSLLTSPPGHAVTFASVRSLHTLMLDTNTFTLAFTCERIAVLM